MSRVFSRPLFQANFVKRYAEGGIVSTIAPEYESPEEAPPPEQDPMKILSDVAMQVDTTEKNLDAAGSIDEILSSFAGSPKTADDARNELADLVGRRDAMATPESVLALVQPTMAILEMSRSMSPPGGIANAPMAGMISPDAAPPMDGGTMPTNFTPAPDGSPVPGFAGGAEVNYDQIMQDYANMNANIPANYGSDPASAWLALAQVGAGMAQGRTFAQGLSRGTEMAGPYMQAAIENRSKRRDALSNYVAAEALRQETQAAEDARLKLQIQSQKDLQTQQDEAAMARAVYETTHRDDPLARSAQTYTELTAAYNSLSDDDPNKANLANKIAVYRAQLFGKDTPGEAESLIESVLTTQGLKPGTPEYNAAKTKLITDHLTKAGTTVNLDMTGGKASIGMQSEAQKDTMKALNSATVSARNTKAAIAPMKAAMEPGPDGKPAFITGGLAGTRLNALQTTQYLDEALGTSITPAVQDWLGGSAAAGEALEANTAKLATGAAEAMSRATNIQVGLAQDAFPKLSRTPEGNMILIGIISRSADRTLQEAAYAQKLQRTYGGWIEPQTLPKEVRDPLFADAGISSFDGYEKDIPFDDKGRPIMSLEEYRNYLDKTQPLITNDEVKMINNKIQSAPLSWEQAKPIWQQAVKTAEGAVSPSANSTLSNNPQWQKLGIGAVVQVGDSYFKKGADGNPISITAEEAANYKKVTP